VNSFCIILYFSIWPPPQSRAPGLGLELLASFDICGEMCLEHNINVDAHQKKRNIIAMLEQYDETVDNCDNEYDCDYGSENNDDMNDEFTNANDNDDNEVMISDWLIERNDLARRQPAASAAATDIARVMRGGVSGTHPYLNPTATALKLQLELVKAQADARERKWPIERERAKLYSTDDWSWRYA